MPAGNVVEAPFASNRRKIFVFPRLIYIIQSIELLAVFIIRCAVGYVPPDWVSCVFWLSFLGKFIALIWLHAILPNVKVKQFLPIYGILCPLKSVPGSWTNTVVRKGGSTL